MQYVSHNATEKYVEVLNWVSRNKKFTWIMSPFATRKRPMTENSFAFMKFSKPKFLCLGLI